MKLFLIRHGQTDWNLQGRIQGSYDSELNETGVAQAKELGKKIQESGYKFSKIYSSTQKRAARTAQIISDAVELKHTQVKGLEEINFGEWEGLTWEEVKERYPEEYEEWHKNRRYAGPPGGESYQEMLERVLAAIRGIIAENSENVAIVTHGAVIMVLQCFITNTPFDEMRKFRTENTSITELDSGLFNGKNAAAGAPFKHTGTADIETERLLLRRFEYGDAESMLNNWIADPVIQHNYGEPAYETEDSVRELLNKWIAQYENDSFYRWAVILKETNENIGQVAFCRVYPEVETAEIEYCIGEPYWGNGYAPEALILVLKYSFENAGFKKIEAFHRLENPSSGRVLEKAGMLRVPNVRRFEIDNTQLAGKICYALTRDQYFS